jgi:hypothetical protein
MEMKLMIKEAKRNSKELPFPNLKNQMSKKNY